MKIKVQQIISTMALSCLFLGLILLPASAQNFSSDCSQIVPVPESWVPSLDQVEESLEESVKANTQTSQQVLNRFSQNLADLRDAQLFIAYMQFIQSLGAEGQTNLFREQSHWLNQRKEKAQASVVSKGGTLAPLEYSDAFRKITEERLKEMKARLRKHVTTQ